MTGWHLFSTMGMLGGDILALFSVMGSVVVFLDSITSNSDLHRRGKFLDMSLVCLIMGMIGQFAIAYTGARVERVGFLQIRIIIVDGLLALSFLFLLASWFIRRTRPQLMRVWRGAKHVSKYLSGIIALGTKYMDKDLVSIANQFGVYDKLGWYYRWKFRRHLSWLGQDRVSLGILLDFEKELKKKSFSFFKITEIIEEVLTWCYREEHNDHLPNRIQPERISAMVQIINIFYSKSERLHRSYRGLILSILNSEEDIKKNQESSRGIAPEQFRVEAAKAISSLSKDWGKDDAYLKSGANYLLRCLTDIAKKVSNLQMFTQFQLEAAKILAKFGLWVPGDYLYYLGRIADKVSDLQTFKTVFEEIVPVIGLETTSSLLRIPKDFQEFEVYYPQIHELLKKWPPHYMTLFVQAKNTAEWDRLLVFLAALPKHERWAKYIHYTQVHHSRTLLTYISGALVMHKDQVYRACVKHDWEKGPRDEQLMDGLIDEFEQTIVNTYLNTIWSSVFQSRRMRWEFSRFTEYIPYGMSSWDWTKDDDKTRPYWNSGEAQQLESNRYIEILEPLLLAVFRKLDFSETEALFELLPKFLDIQEFTKTVQVPVEWEQDIIYEETYNKYAGHYSEKVDVARPKGFIDQVFTFERPYLQNAISLLNNMDNVRETIQGYKKS